jgi:uncharacterized protein (TIGR03435 family)
MRVTHRSNLITQSLLLATSSLFVPLSFSQTTPIATPYTPTFTFDVASVHENKADPNLGYTISGPTSPHSSKFSAINYTARDLIMQAYGLQYFQIIGGPDWLNRARFVIEAKSDAATDEALAKLTNDRAMLKKQHMLQVLLADRFKLKVHSDTKDLPGFALVIAKNGLKMQEAKGEEPGSDELKSSGSRTVPPLYQRRDGRRGYQFFAHGASMIQIKDTLAGQFNTTVTDKTGLTAAFTLQYNGTITARELEGVETWPPLITAIQDQLGLKLEPIKAPTTVLLIDQIERPSAN